MSVNCQGLGNYGKRRDVLKFLKAKKCDIYCLQDTHFVEDLHNIIEQEWGYDKCYFSSFATNARGTAILFNNTFDFTLHREKKDINGNFIILDVTIEDKRLTLVNLYGPNRDSPDFFKTVVEKAQDFKNENYIFCGDFNFVMNPKLDCKHYKENTINNPNARKTMIEAMEKLDILDVFRELHPESQRYTWRRKNPTKMARLDYFLVSNSLFNSVNDSYVEASYRSDHSMVILSIKLQEFKKGKGLWKFNNSLLHNKEYVELVKKTISNIKQQYAIPQHEANISEHISDKEICFNINDQLFLEVLLMEIRGQSISFSSHLKKSKNNREVELSDIIQELEEQEALADSQDLENAKKELEAIRLDN